jgi:hypothetical protein
MHEARQNTPTRSKTASHAKRHTAHPPQMLRLLHACGETAHGVVTTQVPRLLHAAGRTAHLSTDHTSTACRRPDIPGIPHAQPVLIACGMPRSTPQQRRCVPVRNTPESTPKRIPCLLHVAGQRAYHSKIMCLVHVKARQYTVPSRRHTAHPSTDAAYNACRGLTAHTSNYYVSTAWMDPDSTPQTHHAFSACRGAHSTPQHRLSIYCMQEGPHHKCCIHCMHPSTACTSPIN